MARSYPDCLVFLDIDGVLNRRGDGSYLDFQPEKYGISQQLAAQMRKFCEKHEAEIVIATNWRRFSLDGSWSFNSELSFANPMRQLYIQLGDYIYDQLPKDRHITKSEALVKWLDNNEFHGKFVIFDDDLREGYQAEKRYDIDSHFVKCDIERGVTEADFVKAEGILNRG